MIGLVFLATPAWAWWGHPSLMPAILAGLPADTQLKLQTRFSAPCDEEMRKSYESLKKELWLNPASQPVSFFKEAVDCTANPNISAMDILRGPFTDDPDQGMDRDLPDEFDPSNDRQWIGGKTGPASGQFRHIYFGGWKFRNLIATIQLPKHAMGTAPERAQEMAERASNFLKPLAALLSAIPQADFVDQARDRAWGWRTLAWALHYIQDLAQPFHAVQIPSRRMIPMSAWFTFPPDHLLDHFVSETNRVVTNYHWAYEGYIRLRVEQANSPFADCLSAPEKHATARIPADATPREIALAIAAASVELGPEVGDAEIEFFGTRLRDDRTVVLPSFKGAPDYKDYATRADLVAPRDRLDRVSCQALANAALGTRRLIEWLMETAGTR